MWPPVAAPSAAGQLISLTTTLIRFCGAQPGLPDKDIGQQRERQEDDDSGSQAAASLGDMDPHVGKRAGQRCRQRQAEPPPRRHHQNSEQEHRTEGGVRGNPHEQMYEKDFGGDKHRGGDHAPLRRRRVGPQHQRQQAVAKHSVIVDLPGSSNAEVGSF